MSKIASHSMLDIILLSLLFVAAAAVAAVFIQESDTQSLQFTQQASNFLHLKPDLPQGYKYIVVHEGGRLYWPLGPLPSLILLPFLILWSNFSQVIMAGALIVLLGWLAFRLARLKKFTPIDSTYLTGALLLGSVVVGVIWSPQSWFYSHVVTLVLSMIALIEWETKQRPWVMGLTSAALIATRLPMALLVALFSYWIWKHPTKSITRRKALAQFLIPVIITTLLLGWFNWARFGNPLESGYEKANLTPYTQAQKDLGRFSLVHVPSNIYYYFLTSVTPVRDNSAHLRFPYYTYSSEGLSLLLVAPFFLYSIATFRKLTPYLSSLWITVGVFTAFYLVYYHAGWIQFGPRYVNDFFPLIYLLTLYGLIHQPKLTATQKLIIVISALANSYLLLSRFLV